MTIQDPEQDLKSHEIYNDECKDLLSDSLSSLTIQDQDQDLNNNHEQ
jgi:hypothetical protein